VKLKLQVQVCPQMLKWHDAVLGMARILAINIK